jgi:tetratricopeptide (TPR) repeat protein
MGLGIVHAELGDFENALFHFEKAQEVYVAMYGDMHPKSALAHGNIGRVYERLPRFEEAIFYHEKARRR